MIFKGVRDGRPYPEHGLSHRQWAQIPPRQIRLDELVMTTTVLALDRLLSEDSTFYGDLFPHAVRWRGIDLPRRRPASRGAGGAAQPHGAARPGVRHGHAAAAPGLTARRSGSSHPRRRLRPGVPGIHLDGVGRDRGDLLAVELVDVAAGDRGDPVRPDVADDRVDGDDVGACRCRQGDRTPSTCPRGSPGSPGRSAVRRRHPRGPCNPRSSTSHPWRGGPARRRSDARRTRGRRRRDRMPSGDRNAPAAGVCVKAWSCPESACGVLSCVTASPARRPTLPPNSTSWGSPRSGSPTSAARFWTRSTTCCPPPSAR